MAYPARFFRSVQKLDAAARKLRANFSPEFIAAITRLQSVWRQFETADTVIESDERVFWLDPSVPESFKSWLRKKLTDPRFRSRFYQFQNHPCSEHYRPEVAAAYLCFVNRRPALVKDKLKEMHRQALGQDMDPSNLNRVLQRIGLLDHKNKLGRPPKKWS